MDRAPIKPVLFLNLRRFATRWPMQTHSEQHTRGCLQRIMFERTTLQRVRPNRCRGVLFPTQTTEEKSNQRQYVLRENVYVQYR